MSTFSVRKLGASNEPSYSSSPTDFLVDLDAVIQEIYTSCLLFRGEWFENLNSGVPWFQEFLGQPASLSNLNAMSAALVAVIASVPYVTGVTMQYMKFNPSTRSLSFRANVTTRFGESVITEAGAA